MKPKIFYILITAALLGSAPAVLSQPTPVGATGSNAVPTTAAPPADANLLRYNALIREINSKLAAGQHTAAELAGDLSQFDVLLAAEGGRRTELAATIVWQKGVIYAEVLDDPDAALGLFQELKKITPTPGPPPMLTNCWRLPPSTWRRKNCARRCRPAATFPISA